MDTPHWPPAHSIRISQACATYGPPLAVIALAGILVTVALAAWADLSVRLAGFTLTASIVVWAVAAVRDAAWSTIKRLLVAVASWLAGSVPVLKSIAIIAGALILTFVLVWGSFHLSVGERAVVGGAGALVLLGIGSQVVWFFRRQRLWRAVNNL